MDKMISNNLIGSLLEAQEKCEIAPFTSDISDYDCETTTYKRKSGTEILVSKPKKQSQSNFTLAESKLYYCI